MKMHLLRIPVAAAAVLCMAIPVVAIDEASSIRCENAVRQIASAYGSEEFKAWLGKDFPDRDAIIAELAQARSAGDQLRLEVLSVEPIGVRSVADGEECEARVRTRIAIVEKDRQEARSATAGISTWRVLIPTGTDSKPDAEQWLIGSHRGRVLLRIHWFLPEGKRDELLGMPKAREAGLLPSEADPRAVVFPRQPAGGFYVRLGDEKTMISEDGRFALTLSDQSPAQGEIINPGNGQTVATFHTTALVPANGTPEPIIVDLAMFGECGMEGNPAADAACHGLMQGEQ